MYGLEKQLFRGTRVDQPERCEDRFTAFTCKICFELFKDPIILPACGHTFCQFCVGSILLHSANKKSFACPDCSKSSHVEGNSFENEWKRNHLVAKAVEFIISQDKTILNYKSEHEGDRHSRSCPHFVFYKKEPAVCRHCDEKYCDACLFRHSEVVRLEIGYYGHTMDDRCKTALSKADEMFASFEKYVEEQVAKHEGKVHQNEHRQEEVRRTRGNKRSHSNNNDKKKQALSNSEAGRIGQEKLDCIRALIGDVKKFNKDQEKWSQQISRIFGLSLFQLSNKMLGDTYQRLIEQDKKLYSLERLISGPLTGEIVKLTDENGTTWQWTDELLDKNETFPTEKRRLCLAASIGDLPTVKAILESKSLPSACRKMVLEHYEEIERTTGTPLHHAAKGCHLEVVRYLVKEQGANILAKCINDDDDQINLAIRLASREIPRNDDAISVVSFFIEHDPEQANEANNFGDVAVSMPCDFEMLAHEYFGAYLDKDQPPELSADERAELGRFPRYFKTLLLKHGRDLLKSEEEIVFPSIVLGALTRRADILSEVVIVNPKASKLFKSCWIFTQKYSLIDLLFLIARLGYLDMVECLLDVFKIGVDSKTSRATGRTVLHEAAMGGHLPVVKFLVDKRKANIHAKTSADDGQMAPIHYASKLGHLKIVKFLAEADATVLKDKNGSDLTPLQLAEEHAQMDVATFLRSKL